MKNKEHLNRFYTLLGELENRLGEKRRLRGCHGRMDWPRRGVYFFFEPKEYRDDGKTPRVVRVGTHALNQGSKSTLWGRLRQHRGYIGGSMPGGGNHRGSVFRRHIGLAILRKKKLESQYPRWGKGQKAERKVRKQECAIEKIVSKHIRSMPFLWLEVDDTPGPDSKRGYIERNAISLLSNYGKPIASEAIDSQSAVWLGHYSPREKVRGSGLWNSNHVDEDYEHDFLETLDYHINQT